jgi:hypothetical protein
MANDDSRAATAVHSGPARQADRPGSPAYGPADVLSGPALHLIAAAAALYRAANGPPAQPAGTISGSASQAAGC